MSNKPKTEALWARVDRGTKDKVLAISNEQGKTKSDVVREAILQYLDETPPESVRALVKEVKALKQKTDLIAKVLFK